ncbi:MAG: tetratricopeptide repeat protein [Tepidisphaerales bacterium]
MPVPEFRLCSHPQQAVQLRPGVHQVWANLSNGLLQTHDVSAALEASREAIRLDRSYAPAHKAYAAALAESGEPAQACEAFREAIRLHPEYAEAHASLGLVLLSLGDYENGWREHEWRRRLPGKLWQREGKAWDGTDPFGQALRLYTEGGLGNTIQFIRYAPVLAAMGAIVTVECQPGLVNLLKTVKGIRQVVARGESLPHHDRHCPLMSVPAVLKTTIQTIPATVPYLEADPSRAERWAGVLEKKDGLRIGICWQGEQKLVYRRNRSIPLSVFAPLSRVPGVRLISLQKGCPLDADFPVAELPGLDESGGAFMDTAAVVKHLDLVITCDTSIAHLAGALGVPVWVALPVVADWRWMVDREDSPWYPTMRLFRQDKPDDWAPVFQRMAEDQW